MINLFKRIRKEIPCPKCKEMTKVSNARDLMGGYIGAHRKENDQSCWFGITKDYLKKYGY